MSPTYTVEQAPHISNVDTQYGNGYPWTSRTELDTGYCSDDLSGYGWDSLSFPISNPILADSKRFTIKHTGLDFKAPVGTEVKAAVDGVVVWAGWSTWGFGNLVVLSHGNNWFTYYAHLSSVSVGCGQFVRTGHVIGGVGSTGAASCPHLHFELRNGRISYDPEQYLPQVINTEERLCDD